MRSLYALHLRRQITYNLSQGHLLELKLAAIKALNHDEFFAMFGEGNIPNFREILDCRLSPYLSSAAYQFWRINEKAFSDSFYMRGYSGWALRLTRWLLKLYGLTDDMVLLCEATSLEEQDRIWRRSLRKLFVESVVVRQLVNSQVFLWNALGVSEI